MSSWSWKAALAGAAIVAATVYAVAQMPQGHQGMHGRMGTTMPDGDGSKGPMAENQGMQGMHGMMRGMHAGAGPHGMMMGHQSGPAGQPTMSGEAAFGTIQEIVQMLEADPATDWSKVNIAALREHLIDMSEVTLRAVATERPLDNGAEFTISGEGRTRDAIKRMVPAHARELSQLGWQAKTEDLPDGVKLVVTSQDPKQVVKVRALGFMGIMVQGAHHQPHHLMMAKGAFDMH